MTNGNTSAGHWLFVISHWSFAIGYFPIRRAAMALTVWGKLSPDPRTGST
jgi:hypothetical protein